MSELKFLTNRQELLLKRKKLRSLAQDKIKHCSSHLVSTAKANITAKSKKRILGNLGFDKALTCTNYYDKIVWEGVSVQKQTNEKKCNDIENSLFRLASDCYDEGFLAYIKYLKSIVDHNAIKKTSATSKRKKQHYNTKIQTIRSSSFSSVASAISFNSSVEDVSNSINVGKFAATVKRLLKCGELKNISCKNVQRDLKICVNITRSISLESLKLAEHTFNNRCIMSDFLNAADTVPRQIVDPNTGSNVKRQHFHDLIENLNKLEISDSSLLPKITISLADDNVKPTLSCSTETNTKNIVKQDSLEVGNQYFDDYYSSESRPPI